MHASMSEPRIILPDGFRDKRGIYLPTDMRAVTANVGLPPELRPRVDLIVAGRLPGFVDQVLAYATEEELGFDPMSPDDIVPADRLLAFYVLPKSISARSVARPRRPGRPEGPTRPLVRRQRVRLASRALDGARAAPRALFRATALYVQRLILLNALDGPGNADLSEDEYVGLVAAFVAVPGSLLTLGVQIAADPVPVEDEQWMRFFIGHGGFVGRGAFRNELGRAARLYSGIATSPAAREHHAYCPLDDWLVATYDLSFDELQTFAFALHGGSKMTETDELPNLVDASYFKPSLLADKAQQALDILSATRDWYVKQFRKTQDDPRRATFEITPFLQKPALRQPDGKVMPIAPRDLEAWMGATGNHYRYFDIARGKGDATRSGYTTFNGWLLETYVCECVEHAYPAKPDSAIWLPGTVHRDFAYDARGGERRTPDVAVDLTPDLILIEVTSSRLTEKSIVDADPDAVRADIQKVLTDKIEQLGDRIDDILEGRVDYPKLKIDQIERVWPIVVSSEGLFQTPTLWAYITPLVEKSLGQPRVQPLTLFDVEDLEELMGLVIAGHSAVDILRDKTTEQWRELEFSAWFRGSGRHVYPDDSPLARSQFEAAADRAVKLLFGPEAVAAQRAQSEPPAE